MNIIRLKKEQGIYFQQMDPLMYLERLDIPGYFALGVIIEDEKSRTDKPVGLMICSVATDGLVIEWLGISEDYRSQGFGEELLVKAFDIAKENGLKNLYAYFCGEYGRELVCDREETYFREKLFVKEKKLSGEWLTDLRTLERVPYMSKKASILHKAIPLSTMNANEVRNVLSILDEKEEGAKVYSVKGKRQILDLDLSLVMYDGDRVCAGLLVQCVNSTYDEYVNEQIENIKRHTLYPVYFWCEAKEDEKNLLYCSLLIALKKYKKDTQVRMMFREVEKNNLLNDIIPHQRISNKFLVADVREYNEFVQEKNEYKDFDNYY